MSLDQVRRLMNPRTVAVLGASDDTTKWGGSMLRLVRQHGFPDEGLFPVNPKLDQVQGLTCWRDIGAVPQPVDLALLTVPVAQVEPAVRACAEAGVGACLVISANFAEVGEEGARRQLALVDIARSRGMRLVGPNCLGLLNTHHRFNLCNSSAAQYYDHLAPGAIGMVSQSGAMMGMMMARAYAGGQGVSSAVSIGNQADLELCDFLEYLIDDAATRVIALYIEGLKSPERFVSLCRQALARGKPVLVTKAGRSDEGAQAVQSHTGSLAGSHASFEAVCRSVGVQLIDDPTSLMNVAMACASVGWWHDGGVAVMTASGGAGALTIDAFGPAGLHMPALAAATQAVLAKYLPASHLELPFDAGALAAHAATRDVPGAIREAMAAIMADPGVGAGIYVMTTQPHTELIARITADLAHSCGKPFFLINLASEVGASAGAILRHAGIVEVDRIAEGVRVLAALRSVGRALAAPTAAAPVVAANLHDLQDLLPLPSGAPVTLSEADTKALLARAGLPVPRQALAHTAEEAAAIAVQLGFPVALKIEAEGVSHKSDMGGVVLGLHDAAAVRQAFERIEAAARAHGVADRLHGCLVQQMVPGDVELIVGSRWDAAFGPMVMVGIGGTLVELLKDVRLMPAPVTREQVLHELATLQLYPLLTGYRGSRPVDLNAVADVVVALARIVADLGPRLLEFDANPVRVSGRSVCVADARAVVQ